VEIKKAFINFMSLDVKTAEIMTAEITNWEEMDWSCRLQG
jgi:hypothetical protein